MGRVLQLQLFTPMSGDSYARSEGTGTGTLTEHSDTTTFSKCLIAIRGFFTFIFSHVGLLSLVVGYCILGGITFEHLEKENELQVKRDMAKNRKLLEDKIWNITRFSPVLREENWTSDVLVEMKKFEKEIVHAMKVKGWDGHEELDKRKWTFPGSLFYSVVLISTIGYGDQTPKTQWGKLVTIIYSILGIPLFFLCLGHIGETLSRTFRFLYWRVCCVTCTSRKKVRRRCRTSIRAPGRMGPRQSLKFRDNMSMGGRSPRLQRRVGSLATDDVISFTVSNYDDDFDETERDNSWIRREFKMRNQEDLAKKVEKGTTENDNKDKEEDNSTKVDESAFDSQKSTEPNRFNRENRKSTKSTKSLTLPLDINKRKDSGSSDLSKVSTPTRGAGSIINAPNRTARTTGGEYFHEFEYEDWEEVDITRPVPLWICLLLVFGILFGGAFMFIQTQQWNFLNAVYFCFITLSTIGFGDYVPKTKENVEIGLTEEQTELVNIAITSIYMIFGLSLFFMICHLVQEEVKNKVKNIAIQLGIVKNEEEEFID